MRIFNTTIECFPSIHYIYVDTFLSFKKLILDEIFKVYVSYCLNNKLFNNTVSPTEIRFLRTIYRKIVINESEEMWN